LTHSFAIIEIGFDFEAIVFAVSKAAGTSFSGSNNFDANPR